MIAYLLENKERMALEVTDTTGKPITQSWEEIDVAIQRAQTMNEVSNEAFREEILVETEHITKKTILEPLGIVLALLP